MGFLGPKVLVIVIIVIFIISIGFLCGGATGDSWFGSSTLHFGIWKLCVSNSPCSERKNVLKFESTSTVLLSLKDKDLDIILLLIIMSTGVAFFTTIIAFTMLCSNGPSSWKCGAISTGILGLTAALLALSGVAYFEYKLEEASTYSYDHKWSSILTWVGALLLVIATVISFVLICVKPKPDYGSKQGHVVYTHNNVTSYPTREYQSKQSHPFHNNKAYENEVKSVYSNGYKARDYTVDYSTSSRDYDDYGGYKENYRGNKGNHNQEDYKYSQRDYRDNSRNNGSSAKDYWKGNEDYRDNSRDYRDKQQRYEIRRSHNSQQPGYDNSGYHMR